MVSAVKQSKHSSLLLRATIMLHTAHQQHSTAISPRCSSRGYHDSIPYILHFVTSVKVCINMQYVHCADHSSQIYRIILHAYSLSCSHGRKNCFLLFGCWKKQGRREKGYKMSFFACPTALCSQIWPTFLTNNIKPHVWKICLLAILRGTTHFFPCFVQI